MANILYTATVNTQSSSLNVRKSASKSASILGRVSKGKIVDVIGETNGWLHIQSGSLTGWCDASYLVKNTASEKEELICSIVITDSEGNTFYPTGDFTVKLVSD